MYGLDLYGVYTGNLCIWRASRLATQLPPDGAVGRASAGQGYTIGDHLLVSVLDRLDQAAWQRANAGKKKHEQSRHPEPNRRPGQGTGRGVTAQALLAFARRTQPSHPASKHA